MDSTDSLWQVNMIWIVSIFAPLIADLVFPGFTTSKTGLCLCIAFLFFGLYSLAGRYCKWRYVYCAYQSMCHMQMTPEDSQNDYLIAKLINILSITFLIGGVFIPVVCFLL